MPYIKLPLSNDLVQRITPLQYIVCIMLFPINENKRLKLTKAFGSKNQTLINLIMSKAAKQYGNAATLSGAILLLGIGMDPNVASLGMSKRILDNMYKNKKKTSERTLERSWILFNSVAHLWAACAVFQESQKINSDILPGFPCHESQVSTFLALAEHFRKIGELRRPKRARASEFILDKKQTWKLRPAVKLKGKLHLKYGYNFETLRPVLQKIQLDKMP